MVTMAKTFAAGDAHTKRGGDLPLSSFSTTGSISAESNQLTVADASGFSVDDWVIVECGGEASGGTRGNIGVGGQWPTLSYADAAAMNADTSQVDLTHCFTEDTNNVYYWHDLDAEWKSYNTRYYYEKVVPRALMAQVTAKNENTLTLSKSAAVSATNANVYFDNWGPIQDAMTNGKSVFIPQGTFHVSEPFHLANKTGFVIIGSGQDVSILKAPKGADHIGVLGENLSKCLFQDFTIDANWKNENFGFRYENGRAGAVRQRFMVDATNDDPFEGPGMCFSIEGSNRCTFRRMTGKNAAQHTIAMRGGFDNWAYNCKCVIDDPIRMYVQWQFHFIDAISTASPSGMVDCEMDSPWMQRGFNAFKSRSCQMIRCTGRNYVFANNSSDGLLIDEPYVLIEANTSFDSQSHPEQVPVFEFSRNVGGGSDVTPGEIRNPTVIYEGNLRPDWNFRLPVFSSTSTTGCAYTVTGTYDTDPTTPKGLIDMGAMTGADWGNQGVFFGDGGQGVTWSGIRIKGPADDSGSIFKPNAAATLTIENCIFDGPSPTTGTITASGNQTNAEYEAG